MSSPFGELFYSKIFWSFGEMAVPLDCLSRDASSILARTVIFGVFVHRLRLQTVNLRRQVRFLHTPLPTIRADNKMLIIGSDDRGILKNRTQELVMS